MKRRFLLMAGALALAGCAANAPPQPASALQLPSGWRAQAIGVPAATDAHVEQLWWQAFGDPVLSDLVGEALARNGDLRVARARVQEYLSLIHI